MNSKKWCAFIDGASSGNPGDAGIGVVLYSPEGEEVLKESVYVGKRTNNAAEYEALRYALKKAIELSVDEITVYSDSQLLVNQMTGVFRVRDGKLKEYVAEITRLGSTFKHFLIKYISREKNRLADKLAKEAILRGRRVAAPKKGEESPGTAGQDGP